MKVKVKVQYCVMCKLIRIEYIKRADLTIKIPYIQGSIVFFPGGRGDIDLSDVLPLKHHPCVNTYAANRDN